MNDRKLGKLLKKLKKDDVLITSEISRLGRNLLQIMSILHLCMHKQCQVWTIKESYKLGSDIGSKVLAFAFGLSAEIERNLISQRTIEGLKRAKSAGKILGRPKGSYGKILKLDPHIEQISNMIKQGMPLNHIAKKLNVSRTTMYGYCRVKFNSRLGQRR